MASLLLLPLSHYIAGVTVFQVLRQRPDDPIHCKADAATSVAIAPCHAVDIQHCQLPGALPSITTILRGISLKVISNSDCFSIRTSYWASPPPSLYLGYRIL